MQWALAVTIIVGTLPGIFLGAFVRIRYLPDPRASKLVVGLVLLYLAGRLLSNRQPPELLPATTASGKMRTRSVSITRVHYEFSGRTFGFSPAVVFCLSAVVGVIDGIYGIGGGAIIAPFLVTVLNLPVSRSRVQRCWKH